MSTTEDFGHVEILQPKYKYHQLPKIADCKHSWIELVTVSYSQTLALVGCDICGVTELVIRETVYD